MSTASTGWTFSSTYVTLPRENIDTDQIIPARFLTTIDRAGLGPNAFFDWRYRADGTPDPSFALNATDADGAEVLVAGHNFGCGSSREHAVWALAGAGFRVVISSAFADIFRGNALGNGLLPVQVDAHTLARLIASRTPDARVSVDLARGTLGLPWGDEVAFAIPPFSRYCLLHGTDEMQYLLASSADIGAFERRHPATFDTRFPTHA